MSIQDLYNMIKENKALCGEFELVDHTIFWSIGEVYLIVVTQDIDEYHIEVSKRTFGKIYNPLTHWHPSYYEVYSDICAIGTRGNVTVIHTSWICSSVLYSGPVSGCRYTRKWFFGRYHYIYAYRNESKSRDLPSFY